MELGWWTWNQNFGHWLVVLNHVTISLKKLICAVDFSRMSTIKTDVLLTFSEDCYYSLKSVNWIDENIAQDGASRSHFLAQSSSALPVVVYSDGFDGFKEVFDVYIW